MKSFTRTFYDITPISLESNSMPKYAGVLFVWIQMVDFYISMGAYLKRSYKSRKICGLFDIVIS